MKKIYLYKGFERLWHWIQAISIVMLILTGFEIHGTWRIFGFYNAHQLHIIFAWTLIIVSILAAFWFATTGSWKMVLKKENWDNIRKMIKYYTLDIFKGLPHPVAKTPEDKWNPLQRVSYAILLLVLLPYQIGTGVLYHYYNNWSAIGVKGLKLSLLATLHVVGAFIFFAFIILHIYLATTGPGILSYIKGMITGWEEVEE